MLRSSSKPFWDLRIFRCRDHVELQGEQCETESEWSGNTAKEYNEADFKVDIFSLAVVDVAIVY